MKYRVDTIMEINGKREVITDWCGSFGDAFDLFILYVERDECKECLVYSKKEKKDILWYTP